MLIIIKTNTMKIEIDVKYIIAAIKIFEIRQGNKLFAEFTICLN